MFCELNYYLLKWLIYPKALQNIGLARIIHKKIHIWGANVLFLSEL